MGVYVGILSVGEYVAIGGGVSGDSVGPYASCNTLRIFEEIFLSIYCEESNLPL